MVIFVAAAFGANARKHKALERNAINNTVANLIEKQVISSINGNHETLAKKSGYKPTNLVEQAVIAHGFDHKRKISAKEFHLNLRKNLPYLRAAIENTDKNLLDFETKPTQRAHNSTNEDSALILPLVVFGSMDGDIATNANPSYAGDSDYTSSFGGFDGSGGSFDGGGGDSGGGGDGGGGGGGD